MKIKYGTIKTNEDRISIEDAPSNTSNTRCMKFNRDFVLCKLTYLFLGIKIGAVTPFTVIFLQSVGLSLAQAGISYSFGFAGLMLGNIFWTVLADKFHRHRLVFLIVSISSLLFLCTQPFTTLFFGDIHYAKCPLENPGMSRNITIIDVARVRENSSENIRNNLFWVLTALNFLGYFCDGSTLSFIDGAVTVKIKASFNTVNFGTQRMFISIGFGLGSVIGSFLVDNIPSMSITCYVGIFIVYAAAALPGVLCGDKLLKSVIVIARNKDEVESPSWRKTTMLDVIFFLGMTITVGLLYGVNKSFTMLYIKQLGGPSITVGICQLVAALSAIAAYMSSHKLMEYLRGEWNAAYFCCLIWIIRYICYTVFKNPWLFLLTQALHGLSLSLFITAIAKFVQNNISRHAFTIFFGVADAFINGMGPGIGNLLGGIVYEKFGPGVLFVSMGVLTASWIVIVFISRFLQRRLMKT